MAASSVSLIEFVSQILLPENLLMTAWTICYERIRSLLKNETKYGCQSSASRIENLGLTLRTVIVRVIWPRETQRLLTCSDCQRECTAWWCFCTIGTVERGRGCSWSEGESPEIDTAHI